MTILAPIKHHIDALAVAPGYPAAAVAACLARPAEAVPLLRAVLQRAARGQALSDAEAGQLFIGVHILAKLRDEHSFLPLMRLLRRPGDDIDAVLGDATTASLAKVVASVFDGDVDTLFEIIGDASVNEYVRNALWEGATQLAFEGRIDRDRMRAEITRFGEERLAPEHDMAWAGWLGAIAHLGHDDLASSTDAIWVEQRLPENYMTREHFAEDLEQALSAPDDASRLVKAGMGTVDDVAEALNWVDWGGPPAPVVNPMRHVGRNDPCPCGSGKKAKRCCLAGP